MSREKMLCEIQRVQFAAVELHLYLDNFPDNDEAQRTYCEISYQLDELIDCYEKKYGPLRNFGDAYAEDAGSYTNDPWPWEN